jgi:hypothetical protein
VRAPVEDGPRVQSLQTGRRRPAADATAAGLLRGRRLRPAAPQGPALRPEPHPPAPSAHRAGPATIARGPAPGVVFRPIAVL